MMHTFNMFLAKMGRKDGSVTGATRYSTQSMPQELSVIFSRSKEPTLLYVRQSFHLNNLLAIKSSDPNLLLASLLVLKSRIILSASLMRASGGSNGEALICQRSCSDNPKEVDVIFCV